MTNEQRLQTIHDLASARLRNLDAVRSEVDFEHLEHDLKEIVRLSTTQKVTFCTRCPFAMHLHPTPPEAGGCPGYP